MINGTSGARYSGVAMMLHWVIAITVIVNWRLAQAAEQFEGAARAAALAPHKALGMTILFLSVLRLVWRLLHKPPPLSSNLATWEKILARGLHVLFYVLLIGLPIVGWLASSLFGPSVDFFGLFNIPGLPVSENEGLAKSIIGVHQTGGKLFVLLIYVHILGALKNTFFSRNGGILRMLPFGRPRA